MPKTTTTKRNPRGRPPAGPTIKFSIPQHLTAAFDALVERDHGSDKTLGSKRNRVARQIVEAALEEQKP